MFNPARVLPSSEASKSVESIDSYNGSIMTELIAKGVISPRATANKESMDAVMNGPFKGLFLKPNMTEEEKKRAYARRGEAGGTPVKAKVANPEGEGP